MYVCIHYTRATLFERDSEIADRTHTRTCVYIYASVFMYVRSTSTAVAIAATGRRISGARMCRALHCLSGARTLWRVARTACVCVCSIVVCV